MSDLTIFDRGLLEKRKNRMQDDALFLRQWAHKDIQARLEDIKRDFASPHRLSFNHKEFLNSPADSYDLMTSILDLHNVNDLPGMLIQIKRSLKPDGLFIGAMFGGETLFELRQVLSETEMEIRGGISPRVHPFANKQDMGGLLQRAGFALPVVDSEIITVTYDNIFKLIADLRGMGESNIVAARDKGYVGRDFFMRAAELYQEKFSEEDGRITARFEILFLLGWTPHESQQQPLRPGSAKTRLADALGTNEFTTTDKYG